MSKMSQAQTKVKISTHRKLTFSDRNTTAAQFLVILLLKISKSIKILIIMDTIKARAPDSVVFSKNLSPTKWKVVKLFLLFI